ncbi:hypothetical protein QYE76_048051 [Lolium multiflorum]|uniref:Transposase (putative) gypsy type domain-containing protein n=1 Tax=Lolium multiflorum TaxID=4521 RepID=A0AAD8TT17_LOLMU|nr:hypothetical protein QYE76_048051 [Lolium multiflorum]
MEASSTAPEAGTGRGQEASSSGQGSGADLATITRGAWKGSDVTQPEIDWLYRSRRIPAQVSCRIPGDEVEPAPEHGEFIVFLAHFERGFGLPASDFFREFLNFYELQPHHLPGNAIFYLSCYVSFMEAYIGLLPTREAFARFFSLRINSVQGRNIPKPKPPVQCGSCIMGSRQGSPFFKFSGLESCRAWQETLFYACDRFPRIAAEARGPCRKRDLDEVDPDPYMPWTQLKMGRTHTSRPGSFSTNNSGSDDEVTVLEVFCSFCFLLYCLSVDLPSAIANPPVVEHAAPLQAEVGQEFLDKLASRGQKNKAPAPEVGSSHAPPAKRPKKGAVKHYRKREMPVASRAALSLIRSATGMMPETSEDAARASPPPQASPVPSGASKTPASPLGGNTSAVCAAPTTSHHRAEADFLSPPDTEDTGASNIGAGKETAERPEPSVPSAPKKKKKSTTSSPSKTVPEPSAPAASPPAKGKPETAAPTAKPLVAPTGQPAAAKPTPPEGAKLTAQRLVVVMTAATSPSSGSQSLVLYSSRAVVVAGEMASAQLGRITELNSGGANLGRLLEYAEKWNQVDLSLATRGLEKDKLPVVDPAGPRSVGQHVGRLRRAVKEFDTAWHDANNNVVSTLDSRKRLFKELLWEHRYLSEAHSKCQALPETSFEDLTAQLSALKGTEQLILEHRKAIDAQVKTCADLKNVLMQAETRHVRELQEAQAAAESKLDESLKEFTNSSAMLRAELEEETMARKAAQDRIATLTIDQAEYDRLVMQADALALQLFPDSQPHAFKKVAERRAELAMSTPDAPWDAYDHLVAVATRTQHMRVVDRHLVDLLDVAIQIFKVLCPGEAVPSNVTLISVQCDLQGVDLPDVAIQIFKVLCPGEAVPSNVTLISDRLKDACRRIREWQCSAARAGADASLRIACSWYEALDLDALHSLRGDAPTDKDPVLTAKRKDRAYRIAEYALIRTFIPPPPDVRDALTDDEEDVDEEDEDAGEGDAPPEEGDAPPEAPEAGPQPPAA